MKFLIDTNVISELRKSHLADQNVWQWAKRHSVHQQCISVITIFEIELGIARLERKDRMQAKRLTLWFEQIQVHFAGRIIDVDGAVALHSARLHVPDPKPERDAFIAATALVHKLMIATRNTKDFVHFGVVFTNPWTLTSER
jgi:toxin FitB